MKRNISKSKKLLARAMRVIPRGAQTLSKAPDQFVRGSSPYAIERAKGYYAWDVDGNKYIDLTSSLGAIVLGYQHPVVERAVREQRKKGTIFTLPNELEVELAEEIIRTVPFIEAVRYGLNGSDATTGAIRVARAYTGRDLVAKCGYHGWQDWTIATHPLRSRGIPDVVKNLTREFKYNDIESLEKIFKEYSDNVAAVILEPAGGAAPENNFLQEVKELAHRNGAVLIFDELVTGFRWSLGGAAEYYGVEPDVVCYGKAISNGEPLSVFAGKKEILAVLDKLDVFVSFTYAGYLPSIAAALATISFMKKHKVQKHLWRVGAKLIDTYNSLAKEYSLPTKASGLAPHPLFTFKDKNGTDNLLLKSIFLQETAKAGILTNASNMMTYAHDDACLKKVDQKLKKVFEIMAEGVSQNRLESMLEGEMVRPRHKPS